MPGLTTAELRSRMAAARARYASRHSTDEPLDDPEDIGAHVMLPAYLEPRIIEAPRTRQEQDASDLADCIRNKARCRPGERRLAANT